MHKSHKVKEYMNQKGFKMIEYPPYSSVLALADFFLPPKVKLALAGDTLTASELKSILVGVPIPTDLARVKNWLKLRVSRMLY